MKKTFLSIIIVVFIAISIKAQVPMGLKYQAVARDATGNVLAKKSITVTINILEKSTPTATIAYSETNNITTNEFGLFNLVIGEKNATNFADIKWNSGEYWISVQLDGILMGESQILSVPYALQANIADSISGGFTESQTLSDVLALSNLANAQIKNVTDPSDNKDAATKSYTDTKIAITKSYVDNLTETVQYIQNGVYDVQGNKYPVALIGTQLWMAADLQVKNYRNQNGIVNGTSSTTWSALTTGAYGGNANHVLYNWYTVIDSRSVCPTNWHVPTTTEWNILISYLGGASAAGTVLRGTAWNHNAGNNQSGFNAATNGSVTGTGAYNDCMGECGNWWSITESTPTTAVYYSINNPTVTTNTAAKSTGYAIRCLKD